jgi:PAS domain S-box-containing protein
MPPSLELASLFLLLVGIGLAFSDIRLSGWVLGWILLSGALLVQWFRSVLSYSLERGTADAEIYQTADEWMGLGFALLIVASMYMMREVLARHSLAEERLRVVSAAAQDAVVMMDNKGKIAFWNEAGQRIFGYSEAEVRGKTLHELIIPAQHRIEFERNFIDFRRTGQAGHRQDSGARGAAQGRSGDRYRGFRFGGEHKRKLARDLHFSRRHRAQTRRANDRA